LYAFYNFYYILEGLYTRGNTNTIQVKRGFKNSTDMVANVEALISHYSKKETPENRTKLLQTLKHRGMRFDVDGIIGLVVNSRGDLHHFQNNLNRIQPTTFDQDDFETIAWVSFALTELKRRMQISLPTPEADHANSTFRATRRSNNG
jgi:hypothetical protein